MNIVLRRARPADWENVLWVESKSMPNHRYLPYVFDTFVDDKVGEFSVEELDGELVACGKYTIVPDGSAWLETLRVIPERQGLGLGKRLYEHWLDLARTQRVKAMRMYTGITNVVSSGLAERYGLTLQGTFKGATLPIHIDAGERGGFTPVHRPEEGHRPLNASSKRLVGLACDEPHILQAHPSPMRGHGEKRDGVRGPGNGQRGDARRPLHAGAVPPHRRLGRGRGFVPSVRHVESCGERHPPAELLPRGDPHEDRRGFSPPRLQVRRFRLHSEGNLPRLTSLKKALPHANMWRI